MTLFPIEISQPADWYLQPKLSWLVGQGHPSEKYDFVNWDDEIPNIWENKKTVPNHQPVSNGILNGILYGECFCLIVYPATERKEKETTTSLLKTQLQKIPLIPEYQYQWLLKYPISIISDPSQPQFSTLWRSPESWGYPYSHHPFQDVVFFPLMNQPAGATPIVIVMISIFQSKIPMILPLSSYLHDELETPIFPWQKSLASLCPFSEWTRSPSVAS